MKEDTFIFNAARLTLSEQNISILKKISGEGMDWGSFSKKASTHGVAPFIYYSLKKHGVTELLLPEVLETFKSEYYDTALKNSKHLEEFKKISKILPNKIVPLKGIELVQSLYPNIAIRSMCDIDILVEEDCALESWNRLLEYDYRDLAEDLTDKLEPVEKSRVHAAFASAEILALAEHQKTRHDLTPLYRNEVCVEIHRSLFRASRRHGITKQALDSSVANGNNIYRFSNEMMLIHLCNHFCRHLLSKIILRELCDINELIEEHKDVLNWDELEKICKDPALKNDIDTALSYSHILLRTPIPEKFTSHEVLQKKEIILSTFLNADKVVRNVFLNKIKRYFMKLKNIDGPLDIIIFIFRTFVPVKEWMATEYDVSTGSKWMISYPKYWLYLVNVYVFRKK
ncbi:MAG: nucleotidyltransferase family protein [Candidatus Electrothrix communis]|nr:MAG: nucleotidyltransferase family protein [Candidatus Electrothrix communis]